MKTGYQKLRHKETAKEHVARYTAPAARATAIYELERMCCFSDAVPTALAKCGLPTCFGRLTYICHIITTLYDEKIVT
jgi:hypothetical protein